MRYIVTGGAGYIGSKLVRRLAKQNSVIVIDEDIEKVGDLQKNAVYIGCDVCDTEKIRKITGFEEKSVCEDEQEAYDYWKENYNHNREDCCNLRFKGSL